LNIVARVNSRIIREDRIHRDGHRDRLTNVIRSRKVGLLETLNKRVYNLTSRNVTNFIQDIRELP
jgi:hypothetical protein